MTPATDDWVGPLSAGAIGEMPPERPHRSRRWIAIASLVVIVLIIAGAAVAIQKFTSRSQASKPAGPTTSPASTQPPTASSPTVTTTTPTRTSATTPPPDPQATALADLKQIRDVNLAKIIPAGQWVAQLASKTPGIVDPKQMTVRGDHSFAATDILSEYKRARNNPSYGIYVGLLLSTDYGTRQLYKGHPLWVTFAAVPGFTSAADVHQWCTQQFPTLSGAVLDDFCTPRTLDPPQ